MNRMGRAVGMWMVVAMIGAWAAMLSPVASADVAWADAESASARPVVREIARQDAGGDDEADDEKAEDEKKEKALTLERLYPEKSFFGPSARAISFSKDGRYAAYMYRPYIERRHGNDLWIYDTETGETMRVTKVSVMSEFQDDTREVRDDRIKKAKKAKKSKQGGKKNGETKDEPATIVGAVSGVWEGRMTGGEGLGLPPDGLPFTFTLTVMSDGDAEGSLRTMMGAADFTGSFDMATSVLAGTIRSEAIELEIELEATVEDGVMLGQVAMSDGVELALEGQRTGPLPDRKDEDDENDDAGDEDADDDDDAGDDDDDETKEDDDETDEDDTELGDIVGEKDADDDKAPRYAGTQTYTWAPEANELIFTSRGDLYRYELDSAAITRLTRTRENESGVQYLPDGSGYTYNRGGALIRVSFDSHLIEQLDPRLPGGESLLTYRISPDGERIVMLTGKGASYSTNAQRVKIVNYRNRFAEVREVPRHMSDDKMGTYEWGVYLYEIDDLHREEGDLAKVFSHKQTGPRDNMQLPEWAPDSSRVAFSVFEQDTGHVRIYEATFPEDAEPGDAAGSDLEETEDAADDEPQDGRRANDDADEKKDEPEFDDAKLVYQFFHNGGPNTPRMIQPMYLADSRRLVFLTEQSGFRHVHVLDPLYESLNQLTRGRFEVYPLSMTEDHERLFVTATMPTPAETGVYEVDLETGALTPLAPEGGVYANVAVSDDGEHVLANHTTYGSLRELHAIDVDEMEMTALTDSHPDEARALTEPEPEMFVYQNRHGHDIHGMMFKPDDWSADKQYPLLVYVYGGPLGTRKMVVDGSYSSDAYFFGYYMAQKHGYVTCTIDPRGASGYGGLFEKSNFEQVGRPQVEDIVDGVKWMIENHGVDQDRVGMHGWSFGGFQTQMCLYTEPDVFACGIAGAGPTEWENYNSWYSTGTIGNSREGKTDLKAFSLLPLAKNLKAKLLLVHGMEDSNVLYQDTVRVYRELLKAGKETLVELFVDPTGGHGLGGDVKRINRMRKYEAFLLQCLGSGATEPSDEDENDEDKDSDDG